MSTGYSEISLALMMLAAAVVLVVAYQGYLRAGTARRLTGMLRRVGLNPDLLTRKGPEAEAVVQEIWQRCRNCSVEGHCERWLAGEVTGDNAFCPNARTFAQLGHSRIQPVN